MRLELRPAGKPVETRNLELRIGDRRRGAGFEQVFSLVFEMAKIGVVGKRARCLCVSIDMATFFHRNARCPHIGLKEGGDDLRLTGGLLPFPRTGCVPHAKTILIVLLMLAIRRASGWSRAAPGRVGLGACVRRSGRPLPPRRRRSIVASSAMNWAMRCSSTGSGTEPIARIASWNRRWSNLAPSFSSASRR